MRRIATGTAVLALSAAVIASSFGCAATRARREKPELSGFLGDYSQLEKREGFPAALVYIDPDAQWSRYDSIVLDSVTLWASKETADLTEEEKQMLTDTMFTKLHEQFGKYFVLRSQPGPSTLRVRAAITEAKGANVPLRTMTTVVPQARLLGGMVGLAADTASLVGNATVEAEVLDSVTQVRLAAVVDERAGTKVLFAKRAYTTWGDVEAACGYWAEAFAYRLGRFGVRRKPGAPELPEPSQQRTF